MAILFRAVIDVEKHTVKKNSKSAFFSKRLQKAWVTRSPDAIKAQGYLEKILSLERNRQLHGETIHGDIHVCCIFYFKDYWTKDMVRSKKLPDLDNLLCLPLDALTNSGLIEDDNNVCSLDGSRRKPGPKNVLEILVMDFK